MAIFNTVYGGEWIKVVECDFTQSDNWFIFYGRTDNAISYGRNSNWLYLSKWWLLWWVAWKIPSSVYSQGNIRKIEFVFYSTLTGNGWWISYQTDTQFSRIWTSDVSFATWFDNNWWTHTNIALTTTPAWWYTFTIDLENKLLSASFTSTTFNLSDSDVSTIRSYWSNWNLNIIWLLNNQSNNTTYIQKATFYIK
jgi:hypothetical protein